MTKEDLLKIKANEAVQAHINMLQNIINRLADNGSNCKNWLIAIISAIIVFSLDKNNSVQNEHLWICYIPTGLFCFLNCYYLGQQRKFRKIQDIFVKHINENTNDFKDIYIGKKSDSSKCLFLRKTYQIFDDLFYTFGAVFSFTIIAFYGITFFLIYYISIYFT